MTDTNSDLERTLPNDAKEKLVKTHLIMMRAHDDFAEFDVTELQRFVLSYVAQQGSKVALKQVASDLGMKGPNMTSLSTRLKNNNLLNVSRQDGNKREYLWELTDKSCEYVQQLTDYLDEYTAGGVIVSPLEYAALATPVVKLENIAKSATPKNSWGTFDKTGEFSLVPNNGLDLVSYVRLGHILLKDEPQIMSDLAKTYRVSGAAMTGIIDKYEKLGLVHRDHETGDRRVIKVIPVFCINEYVQAVAGFAADSYDTYRLGEK